MIYKWPSHNTSVCSACSLKSYSCWFTSPCDLSPKCSLCLPLASGPELVLSLYLPLPSAQHPKEFPSPVTLFSLLHGGDQHPNVPYTLTWQLSISPTKMGTQVGKDHIPCSRHIESAWQIFLDEWIKWKQWNSAPQSPSWYRGEGRPSSGWPGGWYPLHPTPAFSLPSYSPDPESLPDCALHTRLLLRVGSGGPWQCQAGLTGPPVTPKLSPDQRPGPLAPRPLQQRSGYCAPGPGLSTRDRCSWKTHLDSLPHARAACTHVQPHTDTHTQERQR